MRKLGPRTPGFSGEFHELSHQWAAISWRLDLLDTALARIQNEYTNWGDFQNWSADLGILHTLANLVAGDALEHITSEVSDIPKAAIALTDMLALLETELDELIETEAGRCRSEAVAA